MSTTISRTGDPGQNFIEQRLGETPCSVSISTNAKGAAQIDVKLVYASPHDMRVAVADEMATIIDQVKLALQAAGIPLAGQS